MVYATKEFYQEQFLLGRRPKLPLPEFYFWEKAARKYIDQVTFNRITQEINGGEHGESIKQCTCELAEYLYVNEGYENKQSESVSGRSASYRIGTEYAICQRHLSMTGLMYRGSRNVTERFSENNGDDVQPPGNQESGG